MTTTPTGVAIIDCAACGKRHPETRSHCAVCGMATLYCHPGAARKTREPDGALSPRAVAAKRRSDQLERDYAYELHRLMQPGGRKDAS